MVSELIERLKKIRKEKEKPDFQPLMESEESILERIESVIKLAKNYLEPSVRAEYPRITEGIKNHVICALIDSIEDLERAEYKIPLRYFREYRTLKQRL